MAAGAKVTEAATTTATELRSHTLLSDEVGMAGDRESATSAGSALAAGADYRGASARNVAARQGHDRVVGFLVGAAAPFALAVQGGGYDIVAYEFTGLAIWWLIAAGLLLGLLPRAHPPRTMRLPLIGFIALAAWTAASILWTASEEASFAELARLLAYAGIATIAIATLHRDNWRAAAAGLTTAAIAVSLLALASRLDPAAFAGTSAQVVIQGRLSYPLGYWNALGAWSVMAVALALGWSAHGATLRARRLALATVPALALTIYLTYSRGALVGLAVALATLFALTGDCRELVANVLIALAGGVAAILITETQPAIANGSGGQGGGLVLVAVVALGAMGAAFADALARRRRGLAPWRRPALVAVVLALVALVVGARVLAPGTLPSSAGSTPSTAQAPATRAPAARVASFQSSRLTMWRQALDAFASNPALGIGPGTFQFWWARHVGRPPLRDAHSLYLGTLAELGLPGLAALGAIILGLLAGALSASRELGGGRSLVAGLVAAALVFCVQAAGDWLWKVPAIVALAAGAAMAAIATSSAPRTTRPAAVWLVGLAIPALGAGALMIPGIVSTQLVRDSAAQAQAGQTSKAVRSARAATSAEPWSATARAGLASVELAAGHLRAARAAARHAIGLEPDAWSHRVLLGVIQYEAGDHHAALRSYRHAAALNSRPPGSVSLALIRSEAAGVAPAH